MSASAVTATSKPLTGLRNRARSVVLGMLSLAVVASLFSFLVGPTEEAMAATVSSHRISSARDVVYGQITNEHSQAQNAFRVVLYHYTAGRRIIDKVDFTNKRGDYRADIRGRSGTEYVQMNNVHNSVSKRLHFFIRPGHAYRISAHYVRQPLFFFLPIFTY